MLDDANILDDTEEKKKFNLTNQQTPYAPITISQNA
jgi:hypothetical protein